MRVRFNTLIKEARGSLGETTFTANGAGAYATSRRRGAAPRTDIQRAVHGRVTEAAALWRELTDTQRTLWGVLADQINTLDVYADLQPASGYSLFVHCQSNRASLSLPPLLDAPSRAPTRLSISIRDAQALAHATDPDRSLVTLVTAEPGEDRAIHIYATAGYSPGRSSLRKGEAKLIRVVPAETEWDNDVTVEYLDRFGRLTVGEKITLRVVPIHTQGFGGNPTDAAIDVGAL